MADADVFVTQRGKVGQVGSIPKEKEFRDVHYLEEQEFFEDAEESLSTLLLKKTQESQELQEQLKQARISYFQRIKRCETIEQELKVKKEDFSAHVAKFERFMNENEQQRIKATKRAVDETKESERSDLEMQALKDKIEALKLKYSSAQTLLKDNRRFEKYLERVVYANANDSFEGVNDILMRYNTLKRIMEDLELSVETNEAEIEKLKHTLSNSVKELQNETLVLNGQVIAHKQTLEKIASEGTHLEHHVYESELSNKIKNSEIGEIKLAISNIYARSRLKWSNDRIALTTKLDRIASQLQSLQEIIQDYEKYKVEQAKKKDPFTEYQRRAK